jgi:hypothetical protein
MSGIKLTVILPSNHRISLKISSKENLIQQVLEDACNKRNLNPDHHQLRRNDKVIIATEEIFISIISFYNTLRIENLIN